MNHNVQSRIYDVSVIKKPKYSFPFANIVYIRIYKYIYTYAWLKSCVCWTGSKQYFHEPWLHRPKCLAGGALMVMSNGCQATGEDSRSCRFRRRGARPSMISVHFQFWCENNFPGFTWGSKSTWIFCSNQDLIYCLFSAAAKWLHRALNCCRCLWGKSVWAKMSFIPDTHFLLNVYFFSRRLLKVHWHSRYRDCFTWK